MCMCCMHWPRDGILPIRAAGLLFLLVYLPAISDVQVQAKLSPVFPLCASTLHQAMLEGFGSVLACPVTRSMST